MKLETRLRQLQRAHAKFSVEMPFTGGRLAPVRWCEPLASKFGEFPELDDVKSELSAYVPIGSAEHRCLVATKKSPHAVFIFDEGFQPVAPTLERFFSEALVPTGKKSTLQQLRVAFAKARQLNDAGDHRKAEAALSKALAKQPHAPDATWKRRDLENELGRCFLMLGFVQWKQQKLEPACVNYGISVAFGEFRGAANLVAVHTKSGRYDEAIKYGERTLKLHADRITSDVLIDLHADLVAAYWLSGRADPKERALERWLNVKGRTKADLLKSIDGWFQERPDLQKRLDATLRSKK